MSRATSRPLPNPSNAASVPTISSVQTLVTPSVNGRVLPSLPTSTSFLLQQTSKASEPPAQTDRNAGPVASSEPHEEGEGEDDAMLDGVIIPAISSLMTRIPNNHARNALTRLRQAFEEVEREIPGVTSAFVLEIVENVEQVEEH